MTLIAFARPGSAVMEIETHLVFPNPAQPRKSFDTDELEGLAESIKQDGLIQPVIVRAADNGYMIIAGERRWRACQLAGLRRIRAIVTEATDEQVANWALVENLQRVDLNAIESARAISELMRVSSMNQGEVAERIGKDRATVTNLLRLLKLPPEVQLMIRDGQLSGGHGKCLINVAEGAQLEFAQRIISESLSVRQAELLAKKMMNLPKPAKKESRDDVVAVVDEISRKLGRPVTVKRLVVGSKLVIHFDHLADLQTINDRIT